MSQVDLAGGITAMRYCLSRKVVTRAVSSFTFENPIRVGDVVSVYTDIVKVGTSSITESAKVTCTIDACTDQNHGLETNSGIL